jgi:hypothetical protein
MISLLLDFPLYATKTQCARNERKHIDETDIGETITLVLIIYLTQMHTINHITEHTLYVFRRGVLFSLLKNVCHILVLTELKESEMLHQSVASLFIVTMLFCIRPIEAFYWC